MILKKGTLFVLGADDPEMRAIDALLRQHGQQVVYAVDATQTDDGGTAFAAADSETAYAFRAVSDEPAGIHQSRAIGTINPPTMWGDVLQSHWAANKGYHPRPRICVIECVPATDVAVPCPRGAEPGSTVYRIDHDRPGDADNPTLFGQPPSEYFYASSLGQVYGLIGLRRDSAPVEHRFIAAADHCLPDAYQGRCPSVHPQEFAQWRVQTLSAALRLPPSMIEQSVARAGAAIDEAPRVVLSSGREVADLGTMHLLSAGEAAAIADVPVLVQTASGAPRLLGASACVMHEWRSGDNVALPRAASPVSPFRYRDDALTL